MILQAQSQDHLEVRMVDVSVHSEQPLEYRLDHRHEVLWKRHPFIRI